jgi:hypothetical protein
MVESSGKALMSDSQEIQNMIAQVFSQASKALPNPKMPSWVEAAAKFIEVHPWISLIVALGVILLVTVIIRELICSYLKTNEVMARLKRIEEKLNNLDSKDIKQ